MTLPDQTRYRCKVLSTADSHQFPGGRDTITVRMGTGVGRIYRVEIRSKVPLVE